MTTRPVIGFLTDFGLDGAVAICHGVMLTIAPDAQIVDIAHTVPKYGIADGAYLFRSALPWLPIGAHVAVVDPGVGTTRRAIAIRTARGDALIGPDNGLLLPAAERLGGIVEARLASNPAWLLPAPSATFHGRDIFAPVAAHLALGAPFEDAGPAIDAGGLTHLDLPTAAVDAANGTLHTGVIYIDSFGNLRLAGGVADLNAALGMVPFGTGLVAELGDGRQLPLAWQRTFGDAAAGELLAYEDSSGNIAVAESRGNAARELGLAAGALVRMRRA